MVTAARRRPLGSAPFDGQCVLFEGRLATLSLKDAEALVRRLGGRIVRRNSGAATLRVVADGSAAEQTQPRETPSGASEPCPRVLSEREFCRLAGVPSSAELRDRYHALSEIRARYPELRDDRIRYLEKLGLVQPVEATRTERFYSFDGLALLASIHRRLEAGVSFRALVNELVADRQGQLKLEFGTRTAGATVLPFRVPVNPGEAEDWFRKGSELEREPGAAKGAADAYRRALDLDPELVPALINLANLHYLGNELELACELYRRAEELGGDEYFQIPFNLGNIALDREDYPAARRLYERALLLEPSYPDTHFYLALTLEKLGLSAGAKPHWRAYRTLEPAGEWVSIAREMERAD